MSNYSDYVELPNYIIEKYNKGIIKHVHFADLLRAELLAKHGGTWIDSTVYLMDNHFPKYMFDGEFFMFQMLKPGLDGHSGVVSSWFITASANSKLIMAQRYLLRSYWKKYNKAIDYFFFHHFMTLISEYYTDDWKKVIQYPNSAPHILLLMLYEPFQQEKWNAAKELCPIQKLTYKIDKEKATVVKNSYLNFILNSTKIRDLVFSVE